METWPADQRLAGQGDRAAFARLMTATKAGLHRLILQYSGREEDALDLVQETYAAAWLSIDRYDPERPFGAWLRTIALNKCRDWSRRRRVRRFVRGAMGLDSPEARAIADPEPNAEDRFDDRRRVRTLAEALVELPSGQRAPLLLAVLEGRSHVEIAEILSLSPKAVELRIARARKALQLRLEPSA